MSNSLLTYAYIKGKQPDTGGVLMSLTLTAQVGCFLLQSLTRLTR